MSNQLDQLKQFTVVVADTGDFGTLKQFAPRDATTNPSLILKAAQMPEYKALVDKTIADAKSANAPAKDLLPLVLDNLLIAFGSEILQIVPGRVSTETDADLSFDTAALVAKGRRFISLYEKRGIGRENFAARGHQLQSDAAVFARAGGRVRRGEGETDFALCRPHHGLV